MEIFRKKLSEQLNDKEIINSLLYIIILILPFIVTKYMRYKYVVGKVFLLYALSGILLFLLLKNRKKLKWGKEDLILMFLASSLLVSTIFSINVKVAIFGIEGRYEGMIMFLIYFILFLVAKNFLSIGKIGILAMELTSSLMGIYCLFQYWGIDPLRTYWLGIEGVNLVGSIGNRNFVSTYLVIFLILSLCRFVIYKRNFSIISATILFTALLATFTRSGWLSVGIVTCIALCLIKKDIDFVKRSIVIFLCFTMSFIVIESTGAGGVSDRVNTMVEDVKDLNEESGSARIAIWKSIGVSLREQFLIGTGPDTLKYRLERDDPSNVDKLTKLAGGYIDKAHNELLEYWASGGLLAMISYSALILTILLGLWKNIKDKQSKTYFLIICGYVIQGMFNISVIMVAPIFWIILGVAVKHYRALENKEKEIEITENKLILEEV